MLICNLIREIEYIDIDIIKKGGIDMVDNKIKKKLYKMLEDVNPQQIEQVANMIKSGDNIEKNIDFDKVSKLLKSLNLDKEITPDVILNGIDRLKDNPEIIDELRKGKK